MYKECNLGIIKGVKVVDQIQLSHLLFVDDVLPFGDGSYDEWVSFNNILQMLCRVARMEISENKYLF